MSRHFSVSPIEIEERWSIDDVDHAHEALDYFERLEWAQLRQIKEKSRSN